MNHSAPAWRVLVVDDNRSIHDDFRKIFENINQSGEHTPSFDHIFADEGSSEEATEEAETIFEPEFAFNGEEALEMVNDAKGQGHPYSVVFMDIRMPPHEDGVRALRKIWKVDPSVQAVLCSAYSDYTWEDLSKVLEINDQLLLIRKPFYIDEIRQAAFALSIKRDTHRALNKTIQQYEDAEVALREALRRADLAAKAKEAFLNVMSHEMRTPLNSIIGFSSLLSQSHSRGTCEDYADKIEEAGYRLLDMIGDVLEYSRLKSSDFALKERAFVLRDHLRGAAERAQMRAKNHSLGFKYQIDPKLDERAYVGDANHVGGMVRLLLDNAIKFTLSGKVELHATDCSSSEHPYNLQIQVTDTGIGIPDDEKERLFEMFHQVDISNTREFDGMGVGLALVKATLEHMDGRIDIESEKGKGSTFTLQLALKTEPL